MGGQAELSSLPIRCTVLLEAAKVNFDDLHFVALEWPKHTSSPAPTQPSLTDDEVPITGEKISTILKAANVDVEPIWPTLFAKALSSVNVRDLITNVGSAVGSAPAAAAAAPAAGGAAAAAEPAKEEKKEEKKAESESDEDDDMGFGLFD